MRELRAAAHILWDGKENVRVVEEGAEDKGKNDKPAPAREHPNGETGREK